GRRGIAADAQLGFDLLVRVGNARVGQGQLLEEGLGGGIGIQCIYAEESDLVTAVGRDALKVWELRAARTAPGRPEVDDDRVSFQPGELRLKAVEPARDEDVAV